MKKSEVRRGPFPKVVLQSLGNGQLSLRFTSLLCAILVVCLATVLIRGICIAVLRNRDSRRGC